ncbi:Protein TRANSPARENT TESTA 12 [Acorus gramineus]|uniref:Protein TRANSPARENT TESTA 12 n=1 Tax=Acorus gramineus TaxID=55184 RepID=A0AAV9BTJ5_ACOGR|nr:Protein TRANSPARENT TESTA 12 [Acorus gramineus]
MGHIGEAEAAAFALILTLILRFANGILLGMASATETLCGQAFGARQYHMMGIYLQRSWLVLIPTATLLLPIFVFAGRIMSLLGQSEEVSTVSTRVGLWCIPTIYSFIFYFTMQMYLQAQLRNQIIAWLACATFVVHLALSWAFVVKLGWGVSGAMGTMAISNWLPIVGEFVYVLGGWCPDTWKGFSWSAFADIWSVVKLSMSLNINAWELILSLGFLVAASVRVSNELGRGSADGEKFMIKVILSNSMVLGVIIFTLFLVFGKIMPYAFTRSVEVANMVSGLSVLLAFNALAQQHPASGLRNSHWGWLARCGCICEHRLLLCDWSPIRNLAWIPNQSPN